MRLTFHTYSVVLGILWLSVGVGCESGTVTSSTASGGSGGSGGQGGSNADCSDYVGQASPQELEATPRMDAEVEWLTLEATGAFTASDAVYSRIAGDLLAIRAGYPAVVMIQHTPSWQSDVVILTFDAEGKAAVDDGTYTGWDCPNAFYGPTSLEFAFDLVLLHFNTGDRLNGPLLAAEYAGLPHVTYTEPNSIGGDGNDVCVFIDGDKHSYIFDAGSGDCPAGCTEHSYWGFETLAGNIAFLGTWSTAQGTAPAWFTALPDCTKWL